MRRARLLGPLAVLALGATAAACSGGGATPTVAHLGATTTTTVAASGGSAQRPTLDQAQKFAQCMRSHGVANFPDPSPGPNGGFGFKLQGNPGASRSQMQSAQNACRKLMPNGGVGPHLTAAQQQAFLDWAACIRTHGFPNFPDPDFSGGGVRISLAGGAGLGNGAGPSPKFQAAQQACQSKLPSGFAKLGG